ncbi:MAG TPA: hypothetical protein VHA34_00020, partial [Actinomycetes bacterium]|nr:hypothetical protein [Actinomycetes bacterium]
MSPEDLQAPGVVLALVPAKDEADRVGATVRALRALPAVAEVLQERAQHGFTTMLPSSDAGWVGAELARRFGLARWQLAMSATDANRFGLRFARFLTGRPKICVMDWC